MDEIEDLLKTCDALDSGSQAGESIQAHTATLREGLAQLQNQIIGLREENHDLDARRESLERQIMEMASDPIEKLWENVILLYGDNYDDDRPDFDPAA